MAFWFLSLKLFKRGLPSWSCQYQPEPLNPGFRCVTADKWRIPKGGSMPLNDEVWQRAGPSSAQPLTVSALPDLFHTGSYSHRHLAGSYPSALSTSEQSVISDCLFDGQIIVEGCASIANDHKCRLQWGVHAKYRRIRVYIYVLMFFVCMYGTRMMRPEHDCGTLEKLHRLSNDWCPDSQQLVWVMC